MTRNVPGAGLACFARSMGKIDSDWDPGSPGKVCRPMTPMNTISTAENRILNAREP